MADNILDRKINSRFGRHENEGTSSESAGDYQLNLKAGFSNRSTGLAASGGSEGVL